MSTHKVIHADGSMTPLRFFLQKSMLSTDTEANDEDEKTPVSLTGAA